MRKPGYPSQTHRFPDRPRAGRRQLTRSAPESPSRSSGSTEPVVIVPAAPRRPGALPVPGFPRRGNAPPAPALLLPALAARAPGARPSGPAARSLRPVRPPASQPPAPLFRALGTAGEAARPPRRGPAPPAGPDAGLKGAAPVPTRSTTCEPCRSLPRWSLSRGTLELRLGRSRQGHSVSRSKDCVD